MQVENHKEEVPFGYYCVLKLFLIFVEDIVSAKLFDYLIEHFIVSDGDFKPSALALSADFNTASETVCHLL